MDLSPAVCIKRAIAQLAAQAQRVDSVIPPYPVFFKLANCLGDTFPDETASIDCTKPGQLKIVPWSPDLLDTVLTNNQITFLNTEVYLSWYIPPNYVVYFCAANPTGKTLRALITQDVVLVHNGNHLEVDACLSDLKYSTNVTNPNGYVVKFPITVHDDDIPTGIIAPRYPELCADVTKYKGYNGCPYLVVVEVEPFNNVIMDMCLRNRQVSIGTHILNNVWKPQTEECDNFVSTHCRTSKDDDVCACFRQQSKLDVKYGKELGVSACCFGNDDSGEIDKACAFNKDAYKTKEMLNNCCSLVVCKTKDNDDCDPDFTQLPNTKKAPGKPTVPVSPIITSLVTYKKVIPRWVWLLFIIDIVVLLLFVFGLAFV